MPARIIIRVAVIVAGFVGVAALLAARALSAGLGGRLGAGLALALWFALGVLFSHLLIPSFDLSRRTLARLPRGQRRVALTFDDGPSPETTRRVLACLARHQVRATFFLVGDHLRRSPEAVRLIRAEGHALGNHGQTHAPLCFASRRRVSAEILEGQQSLLAAGAGTVRFFRAPHGWKSLFWGPALDEHGLRLCAWTRGVWDSDCPPPDVIARRVLHRLSDGEIVLLHDGPPEADRSATVAALDIIIPECKQRGFRFVTLEDALGRAPR